MPLTVLTPGFVPALSVAWFRVRAEAPDEAHGTSTAPAAAAT